MKFKVWIEGEKVPENADEEINNDEAYERIGEPLEAGTYDTEEEAIARMEELHGSEESERETAPVPAAIARVLANLDALYANHPDNDDSTLTFEEYDDLKPELLEALENAVRSEWPPESD
ncbi:MAG TPA: hypothetical protein PK442_10620 [Synergistales bacterium]|nr:hypothetical protein [Synergistales bacterium]